MVHKDEDEDLYAAPIVPPPRKTPTIPLDSPELSPDLLKKIEKLDTEEVDCYCTFKRAKQVVNFNSNN